jgi:AcrR family transcriptional regulator
MEQSATGRADALPLRERKKMRTRQQIADAAAVLFAARGYDAVTIAEIARMAEVSEQTIYNLFTSKEQLVLDEDAAFQAFLVGMVRDRAAGTLADAIRAGAMRFWTTCAAARQDRRPQAPCPVSSIQARRCGGPGSRGSTAMPARSPSSSLKTAAARFLRWPQRR